MVDTPAVGSARRTELLEAAYRCVLAGGITDLSLRPLAAAIGSSPRVLLYLFGSKEGLVRALLAESRTEERALLDQVRRTDRTGVADAAALIWAWLAAEERRGLLALWLEGYSRSLLAPTGPWAGFGRSTVADWLDVLAAHQPAPDRPKALQERTLVLAVLRGSVLDLLATGETERVSAAVHDFLDHVGGSPAR